MRAGISLSLPLWERLALAALLSRLALGHRPGAQTLCAAAAAAAAPDTAHIGPSIPLLCAGAYREREYMYVRRCASVFASIRD